MDSGKGIFLLNYKERSKKLLLQGVAFAHESLSSEDRNVVHRDLHGKAAVIEETDVFLEGKLSELENAIRCMDQDLTSAYHQALDMEKASSNNSYISSKKFRLMFLRAEQFDTNHAAVRLARHFHEKLDLFGNDKLACRITQADLNEEDKAALACGSVCITGSTDAYGRLIVFGRPQIFLRSSSSLSPEAFHRAHWYVLQNAIEQHELTQQKGFVGLRYSMGTKKPLLPSDIQKFYPLLRIVTRALPIRFAAGHFCYDSKVEHFFLNLTVVVLPVSLRLRLQCHYEKTPKACIAELEAYGIDTKKCLPLTEDGEFRQDMFEESLIRQAQLESNCYKTEE